MHTYTYRKQLARYRKHLITATVALILLTCFTVVQAATAAAGTASAGSTAQAAAPPARAGAAVLTAQLEQPSWWHAAHLAHLARLAQEKSTSPAYTASPAYARPGGGTSSAGKTWDVSYGYPNFCGDGDGDGWDVSCQARSAPAPAAAAPRPAILTAQAPAAQAQAPAAQAPAAQAPAAQAPAAQASAAAYSGNSSFQSCVITRESGGNPAAVNPSSGAGGLYQFLPSTWASLGYSGLPQNAPVSVQNAAFAKLYAQAGTSPWGPSDGC